MRFGRSDYQERFNDSANLIPSDEPVFLLRGQDTAANETVRIWADIHEAEGGDPKMSEMAREWADVMATYAELHGKSADLEEEEEK